jgi:hypothetical protein
LELKNNNRGCEASRLTLGKTPEIIKPVVLIEIEENKV